MSGSRWLWISGVHTGSIQEIINLTENLDRCDIHDHDDPGRYYIEELDSMQVPEYLSNYINYEAYGRDIALEERLVHQPGLCAEHRGQLP